MSNRYLQYPTTVKILAGELKTICNDYNARRINNDEIKESILWYAKESPDKLFSGDEINPTISAIIGKKRVQLVEKLLNGYSQSSEDR